MPIDSQTFNAVDHRKALKEIIEGTESNRIEHLLYFPNKSLSTFAVTRCLEKIIGLIESKEGICRKINSVEVEAEANYSPHKALRGTG
jgi:hypothetical protein